MITEQMERFYRGESDDAYTFMGAHPLPEGGYSFRVWAPCAREVYVIGDFNFWNEREYPMEKDAHGSWYVTVPCARTGQRYQYLVVGEKGTRVKKSDPYARAYAPLPATASVLYEDDYLWRDKAYQAGKKSPLNAPLNIYELHAGSWRRHEDGSFYSYGELARCLIPYLLEKGYTHVEFLPLTEHPFEGSWGYQVTGYFAPTHRYGSPAELKALVDACHGAGIGVILDWVPAHFPKDESGLYEFDGSFCYEKRDPKMNEHLDWGTRIFDYGRFEVQSFLISSALFWLREYHIDGLRVDAVASMLYLDYARKDYTPNPMGGNWDLDAIAFLQRLNRAAFAHDPAALMIAEESTSFPLVTAPPEAGGLGFNFKWNMGWMNDVIDYMETDPLFRKGKHNVLTFSSTYAFSENYILPFSHDEVVHLKKAMIEKMPGDYGDKFAQLRLLYTFMITHPGGKLNFMGNEFGHFTEWNEKRELDWMLLDYPEHASLSRFVSALNAFYREQSPLWEQELSPDSFRWISADDRDNGVIAFRRIGSEGKELVCVLNFCPVLREQYRLGLPEEGYYRPVFTSAPAYHGRGRGKLRTVRCTKNPLHGLPFSARFTIPPYSATIYQRIHPKKPER